jgi:hypothetical protein
MELYHIHSVIKYKYVDVTDESDALAVDHQGETESSSAIFGSIGGCSDFFLK